MSARTPFRGMSPPSLSQGLVIAAAVCAAWIFWSEFRERGWIPGLAPPAADSVDQSDKADKFEFDRPSVSQLIVSLSNTFDPAARRLALLQLSSIGPAAAEAIAAIRERLDDENDGVRYAAILALWRVSQDPEIVLAELPMMLEDPNSGVREVAADRLEAIGRPATGLAIKMLHSESPAVRSRALLILQRIVCPETFPEISEAIEVLCHDMNPDVQIAAHIAGVQWGLVDAARIRILLQTDHAVPAVQPRIDKDRNSCEVALDEIAWLGPEAADLVPDLIKLLEEYPEFEIVSSRAQPGRQVQVPQFAPHVYSILRTLSALKTGARPAVPHLLGRLKELDPWNRSKVIGTLLDIGAEPELLIPLLTARLAESDRDEALQVGKLLARADPAEARRQVSLLIPKLADRQKPIDEVALYALWGLAREAQEAVPLLISLLTDRSRETAYYAMLIVKEIGPDAAAAVPRLIAMLEQARLKRELEYHSSTFEALGNIGPAAASAAPLLLALLDDLEQAPPPKIVAGQSEQPTDHEYVISALGKIANESPEVQLAIRRQLTSKSALRRAAALRALALPGKDSPQLLTEIIEILRDDSVGNVRAHAALAIAALSGDRQQAIAPLTEALKDSDPNVRKMAAIALGSMGPEAKSGLPALRQAWLEARCGIPSRPSAGPGGNSFVLQRDDRQFNQRPIATALRRALIEIDRTE